jgi:glycosyltransferase involved in cell wall biosynthesis
VSTPLSIGITTRNRPDALRRCVASIRRVLGPPGAALEVIVFDDNSSVPAVEQLGTPPPTFA